MLQMYNITKAYRNILRSYTICINSFIQDFLFKIIMLHQIIFIALQFVTVPNLLIWTMLLQWTRTIKISWKIMLWSSYPKNRHIFIAIALNTKTVHKSNNLPLTPTTVNRLLFYFFGDQIKFKNKIIEIKLLYFTLWR